MKNKRVEVLNWGLIDYKIAWDKQTQLFQSVIDQKVANRSLPNPSPTNNYLVFCEHPPVYTLGKSGKIEHLLVNEKSLQNQNIQFFRNNRGGDITFHGPGQLMVYPILNLDNFFTDIHRFLRFLEECVIQTIAEYEIEGVRIEGATGVWLDAQKPTARKICAMGIRASRWVTMHGIALNVHTNLDYFKQIIPCGISDKAVTSLEQEIGHPINLKEIQQKFEQHFEHIFEAELFKG